MKEEIKRGIIKSYIRQLKESNCKGWSLRYFSLEDVRIVPYRDNKDIIMVKYNNLSIGRPVNDYTFYSFIPKDGNLVGDRWYDFICGQRDFNEWYLACIRNNKWNYININGDRLCSECFDWIGRPYKNKIAAVRNDGRYNFINKRGEKILEKDMELDTDLPFNFIYDGIEYRFIHLMLNCIKK
jgi:hypothetical protein